MLRPTKAILLWLAEELQQQLIRCLEPGDLSCEEM